MNKQLKYGLAKSIIMSINSDTYNTLTSVLLFISFVFIELYEYSMHSYNSLYFFFNLFNFPKYFPELISELEDNSISLKISNNFSFEPIDSITTLLIYVL